MELLAPGGDLDSIKAAIIAGANAIYCGLNKFNARNRAVNIELPDLNGILSLAHKNDCQIFITLNIIILESEIPDLIRLLDKLVNSSVDGIIIQDLGLFYLISKYYKSFKVHASTQLTTHNRGQIKFLKQLNVMRVNLSRELNISEIRSLTTKAHSIDVQTEVFVHGSYCISFSGICYMSTINDGRSANRGRCSQPCRDQYLTTEQGSEFPLNLKDNSAFSKLDELAEAGVDSLKIEGRIKKYHYVYSVVKAYRKQLDKLYLGELISSDDRSLYQVFNRDFSNSFLTGKIDKYMFTENPRDNSATYLAEQSSSIQNGNIDLAEKKLYEEKGILRSKIKNQIELLSICKKTITIKVSGEVNQVLKVKIITPNRSFKLTSEAKLSNSGNLTLDHKLLSKRFKPINETEFFIDKIILEDLQSNLYINIKELTILKNKILLFLNDNRPTFPAVSLPKIKNIEPPKIKTSLSVLIDSVDDLYLCKNSSATIYFQLPNSLGADTSKYVSLFNNHNNLKPWVPVILIDKDYDNMVSFLKELRPKSIIINNTGIAQEAAKLGLRWTAGPYMNIVNSYSLMCLKEYFNCAGAFISNEINQYQISCITSPDNFDLHYSIYHPILLMQSRQCLFQKVDGCHKTGIDNSCIDDCKKSAKITNYKNKTFIINKNEREYNSIYAGSNFLNTQVITDFPTKFKSFLIDLRDIETETEIINEKSSLIELFQEQLTNHQETSSELARSINNTNSSQYKRGL